MEEARKKAAERTPEQKPAIGLEKAQYRALLELSGADDFDQAGTTVSNPLAMRGRVCEVPPRRAGDS